MLTFRENSYFSYIRSHKYLDSIHISATTTSKYIGRMCNIKECTLFQTFLSTFRKELLSIFLSYLH